MYKRKLNYTTRLVICFTEERPYLLLLKISHQNAKGDDSSVPVPTVNSSWPFLPDSLISSDHIFALLCVQLHAVFQGSSLSFIRPSHAALIPNLKLPSPVLEPRLNNPLPPAWCRLHPMPQFRTWPGLQCGPAGNKQEVPLPTTEKETHACLDHYRTACFQILSVGAELSGWCLVTTVSKQWGVGPASAWSCQHSTVTALLKISKAVP